MHLWRDLVRETIPKNQKEHNFAIQKQSTQVCKKISNRLIFRRTFYCATMRALYFDSNPTHSLYDNVTEEKRLFSLFKKNDSINYYHDVKLFFLLLYNYLRAFCMRKTCPTKWRTPNVWKVAAFCGTWWVT